ncbi:alpha/beta hydrolase [Staphylococcus equorum]|mgnify:FL=1|uniref:alpha/beta hydrolase n=1 Tax=Staphylococcus equorum TaxID=246432 RepID=UPI00192D16E2|nr:alpha/beta hydrolase [Staphylococcus equorum]MDK9851142.1 lysophospholipase [Staphylococcus equorum]MDN5603471.1 lysophospholipase [Staphylococcus equorum]MDN5611474.1 lysophospholipase [Staphylococcus equorum]MDN5662912.1 lysophospholipase [Staphylococcus equorum]
MSQKEFKITVEDGTMLEVKLDKAKHETIGVVHLLHGMAEHMGRYDELVESFNQQGYDVLRHNHRGHGKEIKEKERGHIDDISQVADDTYEIAQTMCTHYTNIPYIMIGHSMGSIIARIFAQKYPDAAQGLILSGTAQYPKYLGLPIAVLMKIITLILGKRRRLKWVNRLMYKSFNKDIKNQKTSSDWLSSDAREVAKFIKDPNTGFLVSNQLIYQTIKHVLGTSRVKNIEKMNTELPVLLISGKDDPLGGKGKGIRKLGKLYKRCGVKHVTVHLYKNKRHEVLFDTDSDITWNNMYEWIEKQILKKINNNSK